MAAFLVFYLGVLENSNIPTVINLPNNNNGRLKARIMHQLLSYYAEPAAFLTHLSKASRGLPPSMMVRDGVEKHVGRDDSS